MSSDDPATIKSFRIRCVKAPLNQPHKTASGTIEAAPLAQTHDLPVSSHLFAEVSSHLLAATPGAHLLEWLDVAGAINQTPLKIADGQTSALDIHGSGLNWNEKAIAEYAA